MTDEHDRSPAETAEPSAPAGVPLLEAPQGRPVRILAITGGERLRRRLLALGFHRGDIVRLDSQAILRGPVVVLNMATGTRIALGRGIAYKILVEAADVQS